jgi:DNA-binding response OmpR family regulator
VPNAGRILIVDDEPKIRSLVGRALTAAGYLTHFADSGAQALRLALCIPYDLVILDLLMPDLGGRQVLGRLLQARPKQAVIVLSCVADIEAKVDCLELGAQDYLTKPFSLAELLARVRLRMRAVSVAGTATARAAATFTAAPASVAAVTTKTTAPGAATVTMTGASMTIAPGAAGTVVAAVASVSAAIVTGAAAGPVPSGPQPLSAPSLPTRELIKAGGVTLDVGRLVADIGQGPVPLTRLEFLLLHELAEHVGQSVPKERLLAAVWGYDFDPGSNVVDVCVRRVRSKLGSGLIKTVRGEGYQLVAR